MIPYTDIEHGNELLYTWQGDDGSTRSWAIQRLADYLKASGKEMLCAELKQDQADFFLEARGIEQHRIKFLLDPANIDHLTVPVIIMRTEYDGKPSDLTLDGHHRYVALAMLGSERFVLHHLTEEEAEPFEISGMPKIDMDCLVNSFSGIGEPS